MTELSGTQSLDNSDLDHLESFQSCLEEIKLTMTHENPSLDVVFGEIVSSKQPIEEGNIFQALQNILKDKHKTLRVLQAESKRTNFEEREAHQPKPIDEFKPTEANKPQIRKEGIQLGCLKVQKTKGETQFQVTRWLQTSNVWEAWRQLNLQCTTSKKNTSYQLLDSILNINFETQPASFLPQFKAWKERVVSYQKLSREQLPDFIKLLAVLNGLKSSVKNFVLLHLECDSSFSDLDSLLTSYLDMDQHEYRACRDKPTSIGKGRTKSHITA